MYKACPAVYLWILHKFLLEILSVHPQSPTVTAPVGHAAPLRYAGTSTASVPIQETSLTLRCGPVGPAP